MTYTLPLGSIMASSMASLSVEYGQSFQWTIINLSSTTGNIIIAGDVTGHSYIGNRTLNTNASYRFQTIYTALNTCITYRICN